jgi:hypothetical protein
LRVARVNTAVLPSSLRMFEGDVVPHIFMSVFRPSMYTAPSACWVMSPSSPAAVHRRMAVDEP